MGKEIGMNTPWWWECPCGEVYDWYHAKWCTRKLDKICSCGMVMRKVGDLKWFDQQYIPESD